MPACRHCTREVRVLNAPTCGRSECQEAEFHANQERNKPKRRLKPKQGARKADGTVWTDQPGGIQKLEIRDGKDDPWFNNELQFARLLYELQTVIDHHELPIIVADLCKSMDLNQNQVYGLFDRANEVWERAMKEKRS